MRERSNRNLNFRFRILCGSCSKVIFPFRFFLPSTYKVCMRIVMTACGTMGTKRRAQNEAELKHHPIPPRPLQLSRKSSLSAHYNYSTAWTTVASRPSRSGSSTIYHTPIELQPAGGEVVVGRFHFGRASRP